MPITNPTIDAHATALIKNSWQYNQLVALLIREHYVDDEDTAQRFIADLIARPKLAGY